jgi:Methyltransferase domain
MEGEPPSNARLYIGDSTRVLPEVLADFASQGRNVDFVLVDGDHTAAGVRADLVNLLESPAVATTVIVVHDTMNEEVRSGVEGVAFEGYPKISYVDLDFLTGYMARNGPFAGQLWGGLGLVLVDASGAARRGESIWEDHRYDAPTMVRRAARRRIRAAPRRALERIRRRSGPAG